VVVAACALAAVAAVVLALLAWVQPLPDLTAEDARQFTAGAFEAAGFTDGRVRPDVRSDLYTEEGGEELEVWITITDLDGQPVELWIDREASEAVQINDNTDDGPLLDDEQFRIVDDYDEDPRAAERMRRNWFVTLGATVAVVIAVAAVVLTGRRKQPQTATPTPTPTSSTSPSEPPAPSP
jgi:hypothetical protein